MTATAGRSRRRDHREGQERVILAAAECFRRAGVAGTTMDAIADEAGIARPNLYRYFANKDELILQVIVREFRATHAERSRRLAITGPVGPLLCQALVMGFEIARQDELVSFNMSRDVVDLTAKLLSSHEAVSEVEGEYWGPLLAHGRSRGEIRDELSDSDIIRWFLANQFLFFERPEFVEGGGGIRERVEMFVVPAVLKCPTCPPVDSTN